MGSGSSVSKDKLIREQEKKFNQELVKERLELRKQVRILLLGPSEAGKSTILKQMKILHCKGFTPNEYIFHKSTIVRELLRALVQVSQAFLDTGNEFANAGKQTSFGIILTEYHKIENAVYYADFERNVFSAVQSLRSDAGLMEFLAAYRKTNEDATYYFIDHADRIAATEYVPSNDDMLQLRVQTTGINELNFTANILKIRVFDVGGQRSLRRKWIHVFEDVSSVLFICAVSDYNLVMREDHKTNRMADALQLCSDIFNCKYFSRSALILFLNKKDVFAEKLKTIPLKNYFPDYKGSNSYRSATEFIENKFISMCDNGKREIFVHHTCATDTSQVQLVIDSVLEKISSDVMKMTGL